MEILDNPRDQEYIIRNNYFVTYEEYAEIKLLLNRPEDAFCYRCGRPLDPLTYLDPDFYYQPCWDCIKRKTQRDSMVEDIVKNIKEFYYTKVLGDRYLQLFIVDPIYFKNTIPHQYVVFKKIINGMKPPSRNDIWFLDWEVGYPRIISQENIDGLKIINISSIYKDSIISEKDKIKVGEYEILFPELSSYERHYSRYNIFNKVGNRKTKRIKVGDTCYRLYNTADPDVKSIFKILKNGNEIMVNSLSHQDFVIIKLLIMRNKSFLKLIFDIVIESMKYAGKFKDTIFLKNTITIDPKKEQCFCLHWTSSSEYKDSSYINLSII